MALEKKVEDAAKIRNQALEVVEIKLDNAKMFMNEKAGEVYEAAGAKYDHAKTLMVDKTVEAVAKIKKEATDPKTVALIEDPMIKPRAYIGTAEEALEYLIDNEYIKRGYRINHDTNGRVFKSLFTCHNETVNVWSHCFGVLLFIFFFFGLLIWIVPSQLQYADELVERRTNYEQLLDTELVVLNTLSEEIV